MYEFIEISKLVKFLTSLFVPVFSALLVYYVLSLVLDVLRKAAND